MRSLLLVILCTLAACGKVSTDADSGGDDDIDSGGGIEVTLGPTDPDTTVDLVATAAGFIGNPRLHWYRTTPGDRRRRHHGRRGDGEARHLAVDIEPLAGAAL
jgi:hypothetical protein